MPRPWGRLSPCWGPRGGPEQPVVQPAVGSWLRDGCRASTIMGQEDRSRRTSWGCVRLRSHPVAAGLELRAASSPREAAWRAGWVPRARTQDGSNSKTEG